MKKYLKNRQTVFYIIIYTLFSITSFGNALFFSYTGYIVENGLTSHFKYLLLFIVVFSILYYTLGSINAYAYSKFHERINTDIRNDLTDSFLSLSNQTVQSNNTSYYISLYNNDLKFIESDYFDPMAKLLPFIVNILISVIFALFINVKITLYIFALSLFGIFLPRYTSKNVNKYKNIYLGEFGKYNSFIKDLFSGFFVIKGNSIEDNISHYHQKENADVEKLNVVANRASRRADMFLSFFSSFTQFSIIAFLVYEVLWNDLSIALFFTVIALTNQIVFPLYQLANFINSIKSTKSTREKIEQHLAAKIPMPPITQDGKNGDIVISGLKYKYDDKEILRGINITFEQNKKYAIIGNSGCGKSTLLKIIGGELANYEGNILLATQELKNYNSYELSHLISFIPQHPFIFSNSLYNNITLFSDSYDENQIQQAVQHSNLVSMVEKTSQNYNEMILEENGNNISGGEKQKISISRALLRNTPIILMDESTSNIDNRVSNQLEDLFLGMKDATILSIIHKFNENNLRKYDAILILKDGYVEAFGDYDKVCDNAFLKSQLQN